MQTTEVKELIGLDVGMRRTGIARANSIARLAEPSGSVPTDELPEKLRQILESAPVEAIVVGLPRNLNGDDTNQTRWVRDWVANIKKMVEAKFYWQDEALTSRMAEEEKTKESRDIDALAASVILQDFLDTPTDKRVGC